MRFDGGPGMVDLMKLELATGLSIAYTLYLPGRFRRFADPRAGSRCNPGRTRQAQEDVGGGGDFVLGQVKAIEEGG